MSLETKIDMLISALDRNTAAILGKSVVMTTSPVGLNTSIVASLSGASFITPRFNPSISTMPAIIFEKTEWVPAGNSDAGQLIKFKLDADIK